MMKIAIVDDELSCQEKLQTYIKRFGEMYQIEFQITVFSDGIDMIENYQPVWDIIFMDIKMKHMDGMKTAEKIRKYDSTVLLIFITTLAQYAIKGYEVDALDFVLKPVMYPQFEMKMQKAVGMLKKKEEKYLLLPIEDRKEKVSTNHILYIEVKNHNLHVVTEKQTYIIRYSMQEMEKKLKDYYFVRCNHSYLVNLNRVTGVKKDEVLVQDYILPISRPRKKDFLKKLSDYLGAGFQ